MFIQRTLLAVFVLYESFHLITMAGSKDNDGGSRFNVPVMVMLAEW